MERLDTKRLETIHEFALAPWDDRVQVTYETNRVEVLKSDDPEDITIATSSSQRKGKVGLGASFETLSSTAQTRTRGNRHGPEQPLCPASHRAATAAVWPVHDTGDIRIC
ncbi:hypothetical protein HRG_013211 [Hirsutella rhossiliensis]